MSSNTPRGLWPADAVRSEYAFVMPEGQDWREAFAAHPRIGESPRTEWAREEQAGATSAPSDTMRALADVNREYERRFGHIFIVFATGKTADEMLAIARQRMQNSPEQELRTAAEQQLKITKLRLMKLVS